MAKKTIKDMSPEAMIINARYNLLHILDCYPEIEDTVAFYRAFLNRVLPDFTEVPFPLSTLLKVLPDANILFLTLGEMKIDGEITLQPDLFNPDSPILWILQGQSDAGNGAPESKKRKSLTTRKGRKPNTQ